MRKIMILISCLCIFAISLCACGNTAEPETQTTPTGEEVTSTTEESGSEISDDAYLVGDFTVKIPDGWMVYPQTDDFAEKNKDGTTPNKKDAIGIIKDGKSILDAVSKPVVYLYSFDTTAEEQASNSITGDIAESPFSEVNEIDVSINNIKCLAYEVKQPSFWDENAAYVYQYIFYPISDTACIQVIIPVDMIDFEGVTYEDADVQEILSSVQLSRK